MNKYKVALILMMNMTVACGGLEQGRRYSGCGVADIKDGWRRPKGRISVARKRARARTTFDIAARNPRDERTARLSSSSTGGNAGLLEALCYEVVAILCRRGDADLTVGFDQSLITRTIPNGIGSSPGWLRCSTEGQESFATPLLQSYWSLDMLLLLL